MFGSIRKFAKDRRGAFAMQFALMAVPLCVCTGLAIDGGRVFLARYELASALDAAALAVGSTLIDDADLNEVAKKYVNINFRTEHDDPIVLDLVVDDDKAHLKGSVDIKTYFMPLIGQPTVKVSAESEVRVGGNNVEVAMALDVTGSMAGTRIAGLKEAAQILVDEVVGTVQVPFFSKVAIVPWSQSVYTSSSDSTKNHVTNTTVTDLRGTPTPATAITGAAWRRSGTAVQTIESGNYRTNAGINISGITWKTANSNTISKITKLTSPARIQVTYSATATTYFANGDTVYITGAGGSYTGLNSKKFKVADANSSSPYTFNLMDYGTSTYTTPPSGSSNSTAGTAQRCLFTTCLLQVTATTHGFDTGDFIYITGTSTSTGTGTAVFNNTWGTTWVATKRDDNNFTLDGTDGTTFKTWSSSGTASECFVADCKYRVKTTANHDFTSTEKLFLWNLSQTGSGTTIANTSVNNASTYTPINPSGSVFYLTGNGNSYKLLTGGNVAACANATCNVEITSANHGIANGANVEITDVGGMTGLNSSTATSGSRRTWIASVLSTNSFKLTGSSPVYDATMLNDYTSGTGSAQCLAYGCAKMAVSTSVTSTPYLPTPCLIERYGDDGATDANPSTSPLGMLYSSNGSCTSSNYVTPLTADKARLTQSITDLTTGGGTAGQVGIAWAWYMLSPNFKDVWDKEETNKPKEYTEKELVKVAVLMTDGEFNYANYQGVGISCSGSGLTMTCGSAPNTFTQADSICTAMKGQKIVIYTVGLGIDTSLYADDFLKKCATKESYAFLAANEAELKVAFKKIATSISKLRISK